MNDQSSEHGAPPVDGASDARGRTDAPIKQLALIRRMMTVGTLEIVVDSDVYMRLSGDYQRLHGLPEEQQRETFEEWLSRVHPEDRDRAEKAVREALDGTGQLYENEYRIVRPVDGEVRWVRARADLERDESGIVRRIVGAHIDVTQEKRSEAELRESRERLLLSLRAARMGTYEWSPSAQRIDLSRLSSEVFGLNTRQRIEDSDGFFALIVPEERDMHRRVLEKAAADGTDFHVEYRVVRPRDRRTVWIEEHGHGSRDPVTSQARVLGVHWDISERKGGETALHESRERLRALIEGIPQLLWRAQPNGSWTWASQQWTTFTGLSAPASLRDGWLEAVHPDDRERAREAWRRAPQSGDFNTDLRLREGIGEQYRWFKCTAHPTRDRRDAINEWFGSCTDIEDQVQARRVLAELGAELEKRVDERTRELRIAMDSLTREEQQRERIEERLRQSEKLKAIGQLTGGIAHDFNNMLQTISGSLGVIGMLIQHGRVGEIESYLEKARRGVTRAAALTHRLLAFGRKQTLAPERLSLDDVIKGMEELIRRTVGPEIEVELKLSDGAWLILCDANQIESALLNLCVNARDAMPNGGWLTVATQERVLSAAEIGEEDGVLPGRYCAVVVSDTGAGMAPDVLARAFEPFFTTKPEGRGTGLGLSQIYGFVRQSGGFVKMESTPGSGTKVHLFFPYFATRQTGDSVTDNEPTVLFVEDEADVRDLTIEQFRAARFRVMEAHNAEAAMRLLRSGSHFDVLVSDVRLPGNMDGVQLGEAARSLRPSLPIVLISGYSDGRTLPGVPLIGKPFEFPVLQKHIQQLLQSSPPS